jgi:hypothetical protein
MMIEERSFDVPFQPGLELRFNTALEQILEQGGKVNMGYDEGSFEIPVPMYDGEVKGRYRIEDMVLHIEIIEAPVGMSVGDIKDLYTRSLGF